MAKFCTKCGKKLVEGETCSCLKKAEKHQEKEIVATTNNSFNDYFNDYITVAKGIFTHPIQTIKEFATSEKFVLGLIMIAINCLAMILFLVLSIPEIGSNLDGMLGFGYGMASSELEIPFETLVKIFIMFVGGSATTAAMLYVMAGPVFKTNADIKQIFSLVGVCSVFSTVTTLVATICAFISVKVMAILLLLASLLYQLHLYHGFVVTTETNEEKIGYSFAAAIAVSIFVVVYLLPKILF